MEDYELETWEVSARTTALQWAREDLKAGYAATANVLELAETYSRFILGLG